MLQKVECKSEEMSDVSESLANSSALSEVDDGDYDNELTQLKQDIEVKTW